MGIRQRVIVSLAVCLALALGPTPAARAGTTITVTVATDDLIVNGNCTLREAIHAANTDSAVDACPAGYGADTIMLPTGTYTLSIGGAYEDANVTGDLDIMASLTIIGAGASTTVIDGGEIDQVFHVGPFTPTITVDMVGVTIRNGLGGISNSATLTLTNSAIRHNKRTGVANQAR